MQTVHILGTEYKIIVSTAKKNKDLETRNGYMDYSVKEIVKKR
jgi:hypothetical protein